MKTRFCIGLFVLFLACVAARGQEPPRNFPGPPHERETYRFLFDLHKKLGCQPLEDPGLFWLSPRDTLLVVLGKLELQRDVLGHFWDRGGALLLASGDDDAGRLGFCNLAIDGMAVYQGGVGDRLLKLPGGLELELYRRGWARTRYSPYLDDPHLPRLLTQPSEPFERILKDRWKNLFLATNGPSVLVRQGPTVLQNIALFPDNCWTIDPRDGKNKKFPYATEVRRWPGLAKPGPGANMARLKGAVFAMAAPASDGRGPIVVLAGERIFADGLLAFQGNQNWDFASACAEFLVQYGRDTPRRHLAFIVDGVPMTTPDNNNIKPKLPPMPPITTKMFNSVLADLERRDFFRQSLADVMSRHTGMKVLLSIGSLLLIFYLAYRVMRGRWRIDTRAPLVVDPVPQSGPGPLSPAPLAQRFHTLETLGNFAEPAQALVREWYWQHAGVDPVAWDVPGSRAPTWTIAGGWWERWKLRRELRRLQDLAQNSGLAVSSRNFRKLHVRLKELADLIEAGALASRTP